jgi:hypothetical protein
MDIKPHHIEDEVDGLHAGLCGFVDADDSGDDNPLHELVSVTKKTHQ